LGCKLSVRLGREVVWRHDAANLIATGDKIPAPTFRVKAARQHPGLRSYVIVENSEISAIE
jgi:hypothetical protein